MTKMRPEQLAYLHIFAEEMGGMAFSLDKAQERDDYDVALAVVVDMHINVANMIKLLGVSREDFLERAKVRQAEVALQANVEKMTTGQVVLLGQKTQK